MEKDIETLSTFILELIPSLSWLPELTPEHIQSIRATRKSTRASTCHKTNEGKLNDSLIFKLTEALSRCNQNHWVEPSPARSDLSIKTCESESYKSKYEVLKSYLHDKENEFQTIHNIHLDMIKQEQVEKEALIKYIKNLNTKPRKSNEEPIGSKITTRKKIV